MLNFKYLHPFCSWTPLTPERIKKEIVARNNHKPHARKKRPDRITVLDRAWSTFPRIEIQMLDCTGTGRDLIGGLQRANLMVYGQVLYTVDLETGEYRCKGRSWSHCCGYGALLVPGYTIGYVCTTPLRFGGQTIRQNSDGRLFKLPFGSTYWLRGGRVYGLPPFRDIAPTPEVMADAKAFTKELLVALRHLHGYLIGNDRHPVWGLDAMRQRERIDKPLLVTQRCLRKQTVLSPEFLTASLQLLGLHGHYIYQANWLDGNMVSIKRNARRTYLEEYCYTRG